MLKDGECDCRLCLFWWRVEQVLSKAPPTAVACMYDRPLGLTHERPSKSLTMVELTSACQHTSRHKMHHRNVDYILAQDQGCYETGLWRKNMKSCLQGTMLHPLAAHMQNTRSFCFLCNMTLTEAWMLFFNRQFLMINHASIHKLTIHTTLSTLQKGGETIYSQFSRQEMTSCIATLR